MVAHEQIRVSFMASGLSETKFRTCVRGYHVYQNDWNLALGEVLQCSREVGNAHNPYAVKVMKAGTTIGHLPKKISSTCLLFIRKGGMIDCEVTDPNRKYSGDLPQGGLEIPCVLTLRGIKLVRLQNTGVYGDYNPKALSCGA